MFTLYLDDSGTHPNHKVAVATALIIPAAKIPALESEWNAFRKKEGFECFHASVCNAGSKNQKSEFRDWSEEKIDRVFERTGCIAKKYGVMAISSAVNKRYYDEEIPADYKKYTGRYHYTWCLSYAITYAEHWRLSSPQRSKYPFEFIFSWMDENDGPAKKEVNDVMLYSERASREFGGIGDYEHYAFRRPSGIPALQLVDGIAWASNRYALHKIHEMYIPERAKQSLKFLGGDLGPDGWLKAFHFSREKLREYIRKEQADGRTLERFRRWEKEDREKTK
ncbi:MAG: DUF3800 domain-containing protein [Candidatus Acidiferrales bacterium]